MRARLGVIALCAAFGVAGAITACGSDPPERTTLSVLASSELADMQPLLDELREETGVELKLTYQGTVDATNALTPGEYGYDLAWLSSDRYFQLKLAKTGYAGPRPLSTNIMLSPVVVGVRPKTAEFLRGGTADGRLSWADLADRAAAGQFRFGMADPHRSGSGLAALIGVATAAAGTGNALSPEDVTCDRLGGFRTGHALTAESSGRLVEEFVGRPELADALIGYESVLLSLNDSGKLPEPLEIIYPTDGIVQSEYPLLLLDPGKRAAYDKVIDWLKRGPVQQKIMERTLRRPLDTGVPRDLRLQASAGNALYFPDRQEVVDKLLAYYGDPKPGRVIFLLDFSGSMAGDRIAALRSTFAGLSGADGSSDGKFTRFFQGENFTVMRFGGRILGERSFTIGGPADLDAVRAFVATDDFDQNTAVWSGLDHAYQQAAGFLGAEPGRPISIVLMTDGENNAGMGLDEFLQRHSTAPAKDVHTYTIRFGEADAGELDRAARATGGRMVDANASSLLDAFKETRGCR
ncbi:substrate-binding and vWA domain-containing protein [Amycolatopsis nigrescens]|uniref:substrate-binding and vWA domain-containing protein n=1 Tax=Amycolatopsis nigrescens TaxID=381445 RepID=UPI000361B0C5|nr:VWA domain-containing protein [Amycolatopsis nigrescens]